MTESLRVAAGIGTPLAFLGFVAVLICYSYARRLKSQEKKLEALPANKRAEAADEYLTRYKIDGKNLEPAQKLTLIRDEMQARHRRWIWAVLVAAAVFSLCFVLSVWAYLARPPEPSQVDTGPSTQELAEAIKKAVDDTQPRIEEPVVDLGQRIDSQIQVFPTDRVTFIGGVGEKPKRVRLGGEWEAFELNHPYVVWGIGGRPVLIEIMGGKGYVKVQIKGTRDKDQRRDLRVPTLR